MEDGYGRFLLVFGFAMGSDRAAFADGCARQEAGGRPPGAERIVHALKCGGRWADCADVYGPKKTLYNRFVRWSERGIWEDVFSALAGTQDTPDRLFVDSSCIKVHRCAGGGKAEPWLHRIGRTKGGRNTKLHPVCDEKGRPCVLLQGRTALHRGHATVDRLVADKGYDSQALRQWLDARGTEAVIPPRKNRKTQYDYDKAVYKQRNIIERMFCRLKDWRRIATRFDRNLKAFMAAIALAAIVIWWL